MNEFDDVLQERLERLEAGESLASCQTGLAPEDADLLQLAVQLQKIEAPIPAQTSLMAQRAALLAAAPTPPPAAKTEQVGFLALLASFFNSPVRIGGAIALAVVALIAIGFWVNRPSTEPGFTQDLNGGKTAVSPESTSPNNETNPTEAAQVAAVMPASQPTPANTTFLPILSIALPTAPNLATLANIQGLVEVQEADGSWQSVLSTKSLAVGSQIRTGALSSASLAFFDNSIAALGPDTALTIEQLDAQQPENGSRTIVLKQWQGESSHAVQSRDDGGSRYEVLTPDGSGLARGTIFKVNVTPEQFSSFTVTEGQVDVTGSSQTVSVTAGKLSTIPVNEPPTTPAFTITGQGELSATGDTWIIAGQAFVVNEATEIVGDPQIGDIVFVSGHLAEDGQNIADRIELRQQSPVNQFSLTGIVTEMTDTTWLVAGQIIQINSNTQIEDNIELNDTVIMVGTIGPNGSLTATHINRMSDEVGYPFAFTGVVQQMGDETWLVSGVTISVNEETAVSPNIQIGDIVSVHGLVLADQTWLATSIEWVDTTLATFSISGQVQSIDPWQVAGISFFASPDTLIDPDIKVGNAVRVTGRILPDGAWLADSIMLLEEDYLLEIIFAGTVEAMNPWIISGLPIATDEATRIDDDIEVGDLVRVTARILEDGTWLASRIDRLSGDINQGCVTLTAVVTNLGSGTMTLSNGATLNIDELEIAGELKIGSVVMIIACVADDGSIQIVQLIILYTPADPPTPPPPDDNDNNNGGNTTICHKPGSPAEKTMTVPESALGGHLGHGDTMGACP